jgi:hypothetical protein
VAFEYSAIPMLSVARIAPVGRAEQVLSTLARQRRPSPSPDAGTCITTSSSSPP